MILHPAAREYLRLEIVTDPAVAAWEASFDGGTTWHSGEAAGANSWRWLLAGPSATQGDAVAVLALGSNHVLLRATSDPEVIVRPAKPVIVQPV